MFLKRKFTMKTYHKNSFKLPLIGFSGHQNVFSFFCGLKLIPVIVIVLSVVFSFLLSLFPYFVCFFLYFLFVSFLISFFL